MFGSLTPFQLCRCRLEQKKKTHPLHVVMGSYPFDFSIVFEMLIMLCCSALPAPDQRSVDYNQVLDRLIKYDQVLRTEIFFSTPNTETMLRQWKILTVCLEGGFCYFYNPLPPVRWIAIPKKTPKHPVSRLKLLLPLTNAPCSWNLTSGWEKQKKTRKLKWLLNTEILFRKSERHMMSSQLHQTMSE